jgi:hypothetical protein
MVSARWKESGPRGKTRTPRDASTGTSGIPDLVRRALTAGFSGVFMTGEALRDALGDSVPREWADFAADQSARTRSEVIERLSAEVGRALESVDWAAVIASLLEGRTLEVSAQIRLGEKDGTGRRALRVNVESE